MVGHFDPSWINIVSGILFGLFEYTVGVMQMAGCEAADEEEEEERYLVFRTGAGALGMMESGTGESGMSTDVHNVCAHLCCDPKDAGPGIKGAGIPCVRCE